MNQTIEEQVEHLMEKTVYGDAETRQVMAGELRERLAEGRPLRVYLGVDPTAPDLHLGHAVPLRNLARFQALGHEATLLIGDFTARIGDPSDKDKTRPQLSPEEIAANVKTYTSQAFRILHPKRTAIRFNSEWHNEMSFAEVIRLAQHFTVARFLERDNFARRFAKGDPIHLHEFLYAVMQGYDAVAMRTDVQLGGTDQTFNILAGRRLQEALGQKPQVMLTNPLLPGTDGQLKMSKSLGNAIPITAAPEEMYGKLMSLPDEAMRSYFELLTDLSLPDIAQIFTDLATGRQHPRDLKMRLARTITAAMHDQAAAAEAEAHFVTVFQQGDLPAEIPSHLLDGPMGISDLIVRLGLAKSKSEARRLIQQGGVRLDEQKVSDIEQRVNPKSGSQILRVGKRRFVELISANDQQVHLAQDGRE
jgi:tyrosyl-tRNA synthetase